jgi:membrane protein DedA with SNARE-associated domain
MSSIAHLIHAYGLLVVAGLIGLECVGFPFPGETVLIVASVIAGTEHYLNIAPVILTAAGASIIGRMIGYVIGREYWLLLRYGGYLWITESRIKLGQYLFLRHGGKIILLAQFLPVLSPESSPEPIACPGRVSCWPTSSARLSGQRSMGLPSIH